MKPIRLLLLFLCFCPLAVYAQTAEVGGFVQDPSGAVLPKASVEFRNQATGIRLHTTTNREGRYRIAGIDPGKYDATVSTVGFKTLTRENILLQVGDKGEIDFQLQIGHTDITVKVDGSGQVINTTDGSVGTVIDRAFVQDIPLNGRSFQALVLLSPGVTTATPQGNDSAGDFSVNGQRTTANGFLLDGASAMNTASGSYSTASSTGSTSSMTTLGTTQAIISIDALQEFRIATSTYSAEFGRQSGAQVSFTSRSGTNEYHGTLFEYLRNYALDANNWFNTYSTPALPTPQERQNDFGGVLGGPLGLPKLFSGKDRAFFFFSYEGLRLNTPTAATISYVPSNGTYNTGNYSNPLYKNLRANAPDALKPVLNAFPLPNCSITQNPSCVDYGDGLSPFITSMSSPSTINAIGARLDFQLFPWLRAFARYSDTDSSGLSFYDGTGMLSTVSRSRAYLLGADSVFHGFMTNELRLQYSPAYSRSASTGQSVGGSQTLTGAAVPNLNTLSGLPPVGGQTTVWLENFGSEPASVLFDVSYGARQFQPNAVDTFSWTHRTHLFKVGADYRQTTAYLGDGYLSDSPIIQYIFETAPQILTNSTYRDVARNTPRQDPITKNLGIFAQDEWRVQPRWSLSLGLRWDFNPPPTISGTQQYTYTGDINNPSTLALSRLGAALYKNTYTNFAPRFGTAIVVHNQPGHELVLRAGAGLFYDTGQSAFVGTIADGVGLGATNSLSYTKQPFPIQVAGVLTPISTVPAPPYVLRYVFAPNFFPPSTIQWSASLEQALGSMQSITIGYIGNQGRNLPILQSYTLTALNPLFSQIEEYENGPGSIYNSLQVQYKRQMLNGLQTLASYTWAHAIDSASEEYSGTGVIDPPQRGNSNHDVRNNFTAALIYNVPTQYQEHWKKALLGYWSLDMELIARTGFPVEPRGPTVTDPGTGDAYPTRLNYNGAYPYVRKAGIPGGRQYDPAVFSVPASNQIGNAPRNFLRGFGEFETDLAVQRIFPIYEQVRLQFRAEAFNILNHPNFGAINTTCGATTAGAVCNNPLFGQATGTLSNASIGSLTSIYQQGGPRSLQLALKLQF